METKQEKKQKIWSEISKKFTHLENYCTIELRGIDDASVYFYPTFIIDENTMITSQCDVSNNYIYATRFIKSGYSIEIYEDLLENIIIGYSQNKEVVLKALDTLSKIRNHVNKINSYSNEFITNLLIGNSIKEVTYSLINEVKTAEKIISIMQNKN